MTLSFDLDAEDDKDNKRRKLTANPEVLGGQSAVGSLEAQRHADAVAKLKSSQRNRLLSPNPRAAVGGGGPRRGLHLEIRSPKAKPLAPLVTEVATLGQQDEVSKNTALNRQYVPPQLNDEQKSLLHLFQSIDRLLAMRQIRGGRTKIGDLRKDAEKDCNRSLTVSRLQRILFVAKDLLRSERVPAVPANGDERVEMVHGDENIVLTLFFKN